MAAPCVLLLLVSGTALPKGALNRDLEVRAGALLSAAPVKAGLLVHLGATDGRLTAALGRGWTGLVHGLTLERRSLDAARAYIRAQGLYGRVSLDHADFVRLPYAENLVNLVVAEDFGTLQGKGLTIEEIMRVLAPGGAALVGTAEGRPAEVRKIVKGHQAENDDWTHRQHGPDGNPVSRDLRVGPPAHLQWIAGPTWSRSHKMRGSIKAMVSARGRLFYVYDEAPTSVAGPPRAALIARDAYNGLTLWKRPIEGTYRAGTLAGKPWPFPAGALVATGDRVYAVVEPNGRLLALDAASGEVLRTCDEAGSPTVVLAHGKALILGEKSAVRSIEAATGAIRWTYPAGSGEVVLDGGRVYLQIPWGTLVCLDAADGREVWKADIRAATPRRLHLCLVQDGVLVLGEGWAGQATYAFSASDGRLLWRYPYRPVYYTTDVYFAGGLVWVHAKEPVENRNQTPPAVPDSDPSSSSDGNADEDEVPLRWLSLGLDPKTGAERQRINWPAEYARRTGHHRCYPNRATERYFLLGSKNIDFVDRLRGVVTDVRTARGDCGVGILPANGLIYAPPHSCTCDYLVHLRGFLALAPADAAPTSQPALSAGDRLEKGPAYGAGPADATPTAGDWPSYRHDAERTGATGVTVPIDLRPLWDVKVGGGVTAPTVAGDLLLAALTAEHQVVALDAGSGRERWRFTAGGPVDTPPTIHEGLCLFGCRDGWVYCLRAADGTLVWRLRAAPAERRIVAAGRLESAWPVHGSVLVRDGVAYFAAGRAPDLDGGCRLVAADPRTDRVLWEKPAPDLSDLLVAGRSSIFLRGGEYNPRTGERRPRSTYMYLRSGAGLLDPSWPSRGRWGYGHATGELLVLDRRDVYGIAAFHGYTKDALTRPGQGDYTLFRQTGVERNPTTAWSVTVPIRATALVLAGQVLFAAGIPDATDTGDEWAAFDGRRGGELRAFSAEDGRQLTMRQLDSPPVYDGMAAAAGRLFLSTQDGRLHSFGK